LAYLRAEVWEHDWLLALSISTSWMTVLRRIMDLPTSAAGSVVALGLDDFSFRRGRKFGTILVDLDSHEVIDVLAERSSQTAADWMRQHPEIDYVSRDRGKDYTQGCGFRLGFAGFSRKFCSDDEHKDTLTHHRHSR
jgi:hypothetical protein